MKKVCFENYRINSTTVLMFFLIPHAYIIFVEFVFISWDLAPP